MEKSAVMHMRKRGINKCTDQFRIGDKVLPWVSTCKYLGCLVDDRLNCSDMCGASGGNGFSGFGCLAAEVLRVSWRGEWKVVYAVDAVTGRICVLVWGRDLGLSSEVRWVEPTTTKNLLSVCVRHPEVSLMIEADAFPVVWLARMKCVAF